METVVLLAISRYDFKDGDRAIQGVTCQFLNLIPVEEPNKRGLFPMDMPGTYDLYDQVQELPGVYNMEISMRPGPKHKPIPTVTSLKCIGKATVGRKEG